MPSFKLKSGPNTLKLSTGPKRYQIKTVHLYGGGSGGGAPSGPAGGDLSGTYPDPAVSAMTETSGPTSLSLGAIADGDFLVRSGTDIIGTTSGSGISHSSLSGLTSPANDHTQYLGGDGLNAQPVLDLGGNAINDLSIISELQKISGSTALTSNRGMSFDSSTGTVSVEHGSNSATPIAGKPMMTLSSRQDINTSVRTLSLSSDRNATLTYGVEMEMTDDEFRTDIGNASVKKSYRFAGAEVLELTSGDDMATFRRKSPVAIGAHGCNIFLEHISNFGIVDSVLRIRSERYTTAGPSLINYPLGEIMATTNNSRLFLGR